MINRWYIAHTRSCQERKVAERLAMQGVEVYLPVQKVKRKWSDRVKVVDKMVLPGVVFVRCSEKERTSLFEMTYGICSFMMDKTSTERKPLTIPEKQMEDFMHVVKSLNGEDDISIAGCGIEKGDMVKVVRGPLAGFVCECVDIQNSRKLIIRLGMLGSALVEVKSADVVPHREMEEEEA